MPDIAEKDQIAFQVLCKSGQLHKVHLTQKNHQLVVESFYPDAQKRSPDTSNEIVAPLEHIEQDPSLGRQILQNLLLSHLQAEQTA